MAKTHGKTDTRAEWWSQRAARHRHICVACMVKLLYSVSVYIPSLSMLYPKLMSIKFVLDWILRPFGG